MNSFRYRLQKEDFLTYQLFVASRSKNIQQSRMRMRLLVPLMWIGIGLWLSYHDNNALQIVIFSIMSIIWYFAVPYYDGWRYKRHYEKHINEHYGKVIGQENSLLLADDEIEVVNEDGEGKIKYSALNELIELKEQYLLAVSSGQSIIVPKSAVLEEDRADFLSTLEAKTALKWDDKTAWDWA